MKKKIDFSKLAYVKPLRIKELGGERKHLVGYFHNEPKENKSKKRKNIWNIDSLDFIGLILFVGISCYFSYDTILLLKFLLATLVSCIIFVLSQNRRLP